jgi:predicted DsbA family dithiol-disulfide isomerase
MGRMTTATPTPTLHIDFVSDVACPWCAVGLASLDEALRRVAPGVAATVAFQPFELNPQMGPEGQDLGEHLAQKYGSTPEQQAQARAAIRERGAAVGFDFRAEGRGRVWNTFDAHRLLHWAGTLGAPQQHALKLALLRAYHGRAERVTDGEVLSACAAEAGLDATEASAILASDRYAAEVRAAEAEWQAAGIRAVPAVVVNRRHLIQGGQPPEVFEQALRQIAAEASA